MSINIRTVSICHWTILSWGWHCSRNEGMEVVYRKKKTLNKQSQEGYNLFLRLHCELIWVSPVDTISGLEHDRGIKLIAGAILSHQLLDQTSDEEWLGLVPSSQAVLIQWLASVPCFCCLLLLTKKFPQRTAWRGSTLPVSSWFLSVFCLYSIVFVPLWDRTYRKYNQPQGTGYVTVIFCEELNQTS